MKKSLIALAALAACASVSGTLRLRTADISFGYRMGAGFPGDVNRTHPASIPPGLMDPTNPVRLYGDPVKINTAANSIRGFIAGDTAVTTIDGVLVRPYPVQQTTGGMGAAIGAAVPPQQQAAIDYIEDGFVMVRCNNFAATPPTKGGAVHIWLTASAGVHVQGGFESAADAGDTIAIVNAEFNGPPDANGICEIRVWKDRS